MELNHVDIDRSLDTGIDNLIRRALETVLTRPRYFSFFLRVRRRQRKAAKIRDSHRRKNLHVPPFLIASITSSCNLRCAGCYAHAQGRLKEIPGESSILADLLEQAEELGVSIILLAGGEPLTREDLFDLTAPYPDMLFPLFTNGLLLDKEKIRLLKRQKQILPIISLEGYREETDARRGNGIYEKILDVLGRLKKEGIFFGIALTVTAENYRLVTSEDFIDGLCHRGAKLFFFVEYVPFTSGSETLALEEATRLSLAERVEALRNRFRALFISFPGDEEKMDGCLAAGRGFVHVSARGDVEPCPFAPYSDRNLNRISLKEALSSPFLEAIRNNHQNLHESKGGCALWENRRWVEEVLKGNPVGEAEGH